MRDEIFIRNNVWRTVNRESLSASLRTPAALSHNGAAAAARWENLGNISLSPESFLHPCITYGRVSAINITAVAALHVLDRTSC